MTHPWVRPIRASLTLLSIFLIGVALSWAGSAERVVRLVYYLEGVRRISREVDATAEERMTVDAFVCGVAEFAAHGSPLRLRSDLALQLIPMLPAFRRVFEGDLTEQPLIEDVLSTLDDQQVTAIQQSYVNNTSLSWERIFPTFEAAVRESAVNDGRDLSAVGVTDVFPASAAAPAQPSFEQAAARPAPSSVRSTPAPAPPAGDRGAGEATPRAGDDPAQEAAQDDAHKPAPPPFETPEQRVLRLRQAVRSKPDEIEYHQDLALALAEVGEVEEGEAEYRRAIELSPYSSNLRADLGKFLYRLGRLDQAAQEVREAADLHPDPEGMRRLLKLRPGVTLVILDGSPGEHLVLGGRYVGPRGRLLAVSDLPVDIGFLTSMMEVLKIAQGEVHQVTPTSCNLPPASLDAVYIDNYLGRFFGVVGNVSAAGQEFINSLVAAVRPGGRIIFTEGLPVFEEMAVEYFRRSPAGRPRAVPVNREQVWWLCEVPQR